MKIGVLSDTHLRSPDQMLDFILDEMFGDADLIIHAGDIVTGTVLERMEEKEVLAVCGNMDHAEVAGYLPQTRIVGAQDKKIGLIHGWGAKQGLEDRIVERFASDRPDLIVYGHSHTPFCGEYHGRMLFNPGSAAGGRYRGDGTVGLIEIVDGSVEGRILSIE